MLLNSYRRASGLLYFLVVGSSLCAQTTTGSVSGNVADKAGKPLPKALVLISSPALFQPRTVAVNVKGEWRMHLLPPGNYKITITCPEHRTQVQEFRLGVGRTEALNANLTPIQTAEAVVVVDASGIEAAQAKAADRVSTNFSGSQLETLPMATAGFDGVAALVAGFKTDSNNNKTLRGANMGTGLRYLVDGIDTRDEKSGGSLVTPVLDNIEDVQVVASAVNARNGRSLGSQLVVSTKRGGNEFSGSLRGRYNRQSWSSENPFYPSTEKGMYGDGQSSGWDWTFSGPILKDRIWFQLSGYVNPSSRTPSASSLYWDPSRGDVDTTLGPVLTGNASTDAVLKSFPSGYNLSSIVPMGQRMFDTVLKNNQMDVLVSGMITTDQTLELRLGRNKQDSQNKGSYLQGALSSDKADETKNWAVNYRASITPNLLLEATYSGVKREVGVEPSRVNGAQVPVLLNLYAPTAAYESMRWLNYGSNRPFVIMRNRASNVPERHGNRTVEVNLKAFVDTLGHHEFDIGFEDYRSIYNPGTEIGDLGYEVHSGGVVGNGTDYLFPTVVFEGVGVNRQRYGSFADQYGPAPVIKESWASSKDQENRTRAAWINDNWTISPHWNASIGIRWNSYRIDDQTGRNIQSDRAVEPRLQLRWDPTGEGKDTFSIAFTRNNLSFSSELASRLVTNPANYYTMRGWKGIDGQPTISSLAGGGTDGGMYGVRWATYAQLIDKNNYNETPYAFYNGWVQNVSSKLKTPYADQVEFTYQHRFNEGGSARLSLIDKRFKREVVSYSDYTWDYLALATDPSGRSNLAQWVWQTHWANSPLDRIYRSAELSLDDNITPNLAWHLSWTYTYQKNQDYEGTLNYVAVKNNPAASPVGAEAYRENGLTRKDHLVTGYLQYTQKVGKGSIYITLSPTYTAAGPGSLDVANNTSVAGLGFNAVDSVRNPNGYTVPGTQTNYLYWYYGGYGEFKQRLDTFEMNLSVAWNVPLGYRKLAFVGNVSVANLLHHVVYKGPWGSNFSTVSGGASYPKGRAFGNFNVGYYDALGGNVFRGWGADISDLSDSNQHLYDVSSRSGYGQITAGIRF